MRKEESVREPARIELTDHVTTLLPVVYDAARYPLELCVTPTRTTKKDAKVGIEVFRGRAADRITVIEVRSLCAYLEHGIRTHECAYTIEREVGTDVLCGEPDGAPNLIFVCAPTRTMVHCHPFVLLRWCNEGAEGTPPSKERGAKHREVRIPFPAHDHCLSSWRWFWGRIGGTVVTREPEVTIGVGY